MQLTQPAFMIEQMPFGNIGGAAITLYKLTNAHGFSVEIMNYGATIVAIHTPDRSGSLGDVVLGFDSLDGYLQKDNPYFGCIVGRYANRIAKAQFELNGRTYPLHANNNGNTLHGGLKGLDKVVWQVENASDHALTLRYLSPDGEEGFPGNLLVKVIYTITSDNALRIEYEANTDKITPVNLTNHTYFNLSAGESDTILKHELHINAGFFTPVDALLLPTGKMEPVQGNAMDFTRPKPVGKDLAQVDGGYDHNYVLHKKEAELSRAATLYDPASGRMLEMWTTEPSVQFYSGNFLEGNLVNKNGQIIPKHSGLCLEAQHFPDSPNQPQFPNVFLKPGEKYMQTTIYRFGANIN